MNSVDGERSPGRTLRSVDLGAGAVSETAHKRSLAEHSHERMSFCLVLAGDVTERRNGTTIRHGRGDLITRWENERHENQFGDRGARCLNLHVAPELLERVSRRTELQHRAARLMRALRNELRSDRSGLVLEGLVYQIVGEYFRGSAPRGGADRAMHIIRDRFAEPLTLRAVARELDMHPVSLARAFRIRYGCTFGEALRATRSNYAVELLADPRHTIASIAILTGFVDQSHLTKTLRLVTGRTPKVLRQQLVSRAYGSSLHTESEPDP